MPRPNYLADHGLALIDNGYPIIPIKPGTKAPQGEGWTKVRATSAQYRRWVKDGYGSFGIGILTEHFPVMDIDTLNPGVAEDMVEWCDLNQGVALVRVGRAPKTLLAYRTDEPFTKRFSSEWTDNPPQHDAKGRPIIHRLEVLAKGQQFVAYAIHPDTKEPYTWTYEQLQPLVVPSGDLPLLNVAGAEAACAAFDVIAEKHGLIRLGRTRSQPGPLANGHDWTADLPVTKVGFTLDQMRETLADVPNDGEHSLDYDPWTWIGMAIYHETDGSEDGFDLFENFSDRSYKHNHAETAEKWKSFSIEGKAQRPITFRYAIKLAQENRQASVEAVIGQLKADLLAARTKTEFTAVGDRLKHAEITQLDRNAFRPLAAEVYGRIYGAKMSLTLISQFVRAAPPPTDRMPEWLEPYVLDESTNTFFSRVSKKPLTVAAFNNRYNRYLITPAEHAAGKVVPDANASDWANNVYQIPVVAGVRYCPWEKPLFYRDGKLHANSYNDALIPAVPATLTHRQENAVDIFKRHLKHMIIDPRELDLFLDWLCYTVQTGRRCNWAAVMLGCESDGKTWFGKLMKRVLGGNVTVVSATSMADKYNSWAEDAQVVVAEEIRFAGHNRHDIMNKLKELITNEDIEIHRKNQSQYQTVNTAQYLMFTNHQDALPVDEASTRYFIIRTKWQRLADIKVFIAENPTYYAELDKTLNYPDGIAAIRKFMLEKTPCPEFSAVKRAPDSEGKQYMTHMARGSDEDTLREEIERGADPLLCETLISVAHAQAFMQTAGGQLGSSEHVGRILKRAEFQSLGQVRIGAERHRLWSATPAMFQRNRKTMPRLVLDYLRQKAEDQEV